MKGIAGDAVFVAIAILVVALLTVKFWYPPLVRLVNSVKNDIHEVKEDEEEQDYWRDTRMKQYLSREDRIKLANSVKRASGLSNKNKR